jgi:hypothetical protein
MAASIWSEREMNVRVTRVRLRRSEIEYSGVGPGQLSNIKVGIAMKNERRSEALRKN